MESRKIVKDLSKKDFSTVLNDIQILTSEGKKVDCSEICSILRALYQAVVPSSVEIESSKACIINMIPCINLCIDHVQNNYSCSDLVQNQFFPILYHIIRTFLKAELYYPALSCGNILKTFLEDSKSDFDDKITYIKNMSTIFWNDALHIEKNLDIDFDMALALRAASIEFFLLDKACINSVNEKINIALARYCNNNNNVDIEKLRSFLQTTWLHLEKFSNSYDHKAYLYKSLQMWCHILYKYVKDYSIMKQFLACLQDLSVPSKKKEHKVLNTCCDLSKVCIQFFMLRESNIKFKVFSDYKNLCKNYKQWNEIDVKIFVSSCQLIDSTFTKCFQSLKDSEEETLSTFLQSNISSCVTLLKHLVDIFSEELVQKHLPHSKYVFCITLTNLFSKLLRKEQNETENRNQLINEAEEFVKFSATKVTLLTDIVDVNKNIVTFACCITRLALILYGFELYSKSIPFFEVADRIFSLCSSLPEYNTEETQHYVWKCHEVFAYVCFMTGAHEKSLQVVIKSLIIHEKKTKECFDLWRKVKRDAVRIGNDSVLPKTISDCLLDLNSEVCVEKEIMYLFEEFKICKSERCKVDEEIINVSQKILSMPCSNSVRAYVLLEILTLPSNLSDRMCELLKKSLSEICMETINLYVDILSKNPEDYTSKLYLSIAYFWLYHNGLKQIHDIAEKEAQNLLKPPPPKPVTGVQNDVEEENDTCDIQPVHPLVSFSVENETFKNLNLAVQLWNGISDSQWQDLSPITKAKNVLDIILAAAEIFSTAVNECKELKLWLLLRSVSITLKSKLHELTAGISLINLFTRLGYLNMASYFLKEIESDSESFSNSNFENIQVKFQLSKSYYFLHTQKFDEGLQIVRDILINPVLQKKYKSVKMLHAETLLLLSDYLVLPTKAFSYSSNIEYIVTNSPLAHLMESVSICKALLKHFSEKRASSNGFDWIFFKPVLIKNLLQAHILMGELYFKSGDPRLSRCYLQDALKLAESQILTYWSSKILLVLGHIDFMCDNFKDCHVKAGGLKYIMDQGTKANCLEILNNLQAKYCTLHSDEPLSPDSPDGFAISTVSDIALPRQIKQTFIDKIDVVSSPMSKRHPKNNIDKNQFNFNEENFSMNLLQLESSLLSYLLSQTETDTKQTDEVLQELFNYYSQIKNLEYLHNILTSVKLNNKVKDPHSRLKSKLEVILFVSIKLQQLESYCVKNDILNAKETVKKAFSFLEKASICPNYSYPDIYALLKYQDIRVTLCDFYQIPLNSSVAYYFCPSFMPNMPSKKKVHTQNSSVVNTPTTPVSRIAPSIVVTEYKDKAKKCQAPLKKNLLNTNMQKELSEITALNSPFVIFSSSDEQENFESPFNSLSRASKTRSGSNKISKKNIRTKKNPDFHYQIFTQKNNALEVKDASDVWNLCLTDTPKLGKENRKLKSAKTLPKPALVSKKKTHSAASASQTSKPSKTRRTKKSNHNSILSADSNALKLDEPSIYNDYTESHSPGRKLSIEYSRSSPHKISETGTLSKTSTNDTFIPETLPKPELISKKKTRSAASASQASRPRRTRRTKKSPDNPILSSDSNTCKLDEPLKHNDFTESHSSDRKLSIEYSRSSPLKISETGTVSKTSTDDKVSPFFADDLLLSDNVFLSPSKNTQKSKIPCLIDDLCKDLSSLSLRKSKSPHVAAGNLDEIINELKELRLLIHNSMPYPLYGDICKLLGILLLIKRDGSWNDENILDSSFLLSEAFSLSLRSVYIGNMTYYKQSEFQNDRELIIKTLKNTDCLIGSRVESFLKVIPKDWTVIQVSALHNQEYLAAHDPLPCPTKLVLAQYQRNSPPIILSTDCSFDERFSSSFLTEFEKILEGSYLTMLNNDSKSWWTTRSSLDVRMKELTRDMENIWLGCWKGLFLGMPQNEDRIKQLQITVDAISKLAPCTNNKLLQILIDSAQHLSKEQVCAAVCYLWNCNHDDVIHKKLCKSIRNISIALPETDRLPVILILDQSIQDLPWECMPILKGVPITRMPSLSILHAKLTVMESESVLDTGFDTSKTYYVLNPGGDLTNSQQYFQYRFESQAGWNGVIGTAPCAKDYISGLKDHDFFIYCGHGSGRKYLEGTSVDKLKLHSTSILMGCSSGKLRRLGRTLEAHGIVLRLLLSGCPSITANLWDVTDKDIDRFTDKLLQSIVPNYDDLQCKKYDVAKAVSLSRSACKMRFLVGAAPVVYGFPVFAMSE